ncbi:hypothetical protein SEUCBS139899_005656 [Sporothrix eucalyptigena]
MAGASSAQNNSPWEDATIAKSWDRVVDDYKIFHDVRARGGTVDDLPASLRDTPTGPETSQYAKPETNGNPAQEGAHGDVMAADEGATAAAVGGDGSGQGTLPVPGLLSPQTVLGGADEGLKKLLMSWYYAGYYTGLYEGQQQAAAAQQQQPQTHTSQEAQASEPAGGIGMDLENGQEVQQ